MSVYVCPRARVKGVSQRKRNHFRIGAYVLLLKIKKILHNHMSTLCFRITADTMQRATREMLGQAENCINSEGWQ